MVVEKQNVPSMQEMLHSLIPKCQTLFPIICEKWSHKNSLNHHKKHDMFPHKGVFENDKAY